MFRQISAAKKIFGEITINGDKSISHRALMLAALADGESRIQNLNEGADVNSTIECLQQLGVKIEKDGDIATVYGRSTTGLKKPINILDVGNSGTTIRLLSGVLAGQKFESSITGDASIRRRPMGRITVPLRQMGARVETLNGELAPLTIKGGQLTPIRYELPIASAQVKSCLLFAGLFAEGQTTIVEPTVSRDHTERMLPCFNVEMTKSDNAVTVTGPAYLQGQNLYVSGDISSAAYFIAVASLIKRSEVFIKKVGINPTRKAFLDLLIEAGANVEMTSVDEKNNEPYADLIVRHADLEAFQVKPNLVPQLIDEIPMLAVIATQAHGASTFAGVGELRHKESNRLQAIIVNLRKMGANIEEIQDGLVIEGPTQLYGAHLDSFYDHRIAMCFTVAALIANGVSKIESSEVVDISYPGFFDDLAKLTDG